MFADTLTGKISDIHINEIGNMVSSYHILSEQALSLEKVYILELSVKRVDSDINCAIAQSENVCEIYKLGNAQFNHVASLKGHSDQITGVKFCPDTDSVVYTSSQDGKLKVWDIRSSECVREFKDPTFKPLSCMDISSNNRVICTGTELIKGDAFLLFWDLRSKNLLGGYWESHTDVITDVSFHPQESDVMASGSTDGLVNIFDLKQSNEDDALSTSLNTESSVARSKWQNSDMLSVITHTEEVHIWEREGSSPKHVFSREDICNSLKVPIDDGYAVNVHSRSAGDMFLLAGSHSGKGECLEMLPLDNGKIKSGIKLIGNNQIIRTSQYLPEIDILFTGGESGCLCAWKAGSEKISSNLKETGKPRSKQKHKPY